MLVDQSSEQVPAIDEAALSKIARKAGARRTLMVNFLMQTDAHTDRTGQVTKAFASAMAATDNSSVRLSPCRTVGSLTEPAESSVHTFRRPDRVHPNRDIYA